MDDTIALLRDLVAIDSVNPSLVPGGAGEAEIARAVAHVLSAAGLDVKLDEVAPGRPNVVGLVEGRGRGRSLMLCGHLDTVGIAGMEAPFDPVIRDGKVYGRGSQDMKGGLAAIIGTALAVATSGLAAGRLLVVAVCDEEYASIGAEAIAQGRRADGAVVAEPTDLVVAIGHKGFSWVEVETRGRAAHGSRPREGRDAIFRMGRVLARLESLDQELQSLPPHPLLGTASLHASLINGGRELSTYPDHCTLRLERRTLVAERESLALEEVEVILAKLKAEDPELEASARLFFHRPAYETPQGHVLPALIEAALARAGRSASCAGVTFWTDAAILGHAGTPSVIFGPGGAGAHGLEEHVRIDEVLACRDVLIDTVRAFCLEPR